MDVPNGQPARFGVPVFGGSALVYFDASVRPKDHGITVTSSDISHILPIAGTKLELWGVPADPTHDADRYIQGTTQGTSAGVDRVPFLTMPTTCDGPIATRLRANSWQEPDAWIEREYLGPAMEGCDVLDFQPDVKVQPQSSVADSPSAYTVEVSQRLSESPESLATSQLKDAVISLPEGVAINPAAADGLAACSEAEFGLGEEGEPGCASASRVGQVRIETPVLDEPLVGPVFQAQQGSNPFGSMLALYMAPESERYGVRIKLAGKVEADPVTGRLTASFLDNPQQPFSKLTLSLKGGNRAVLVNPATCGTKTTDWSMTPWARPDDAVDGTDSFEITSGPGGASCAANQAERGFAPELEAGSVNPVAGAFSPFVMRLSRADGQQDLTGLSATLPEGLSGRLAGVPYCPEAALASLVGSPNTAPGTGAAEAAVSACPAGSQVGRVVIGAGAGPSPFFVHGGRVFLAGPYKGAPLSLAVVVPALAGPFDLGSVLVRNALHLDERTARLRVVSDPIPTILEGIPLRIRDLRVIVDRPDFTINPTNCRAQQVAVEVAGTHGVTSSLANRFQVADCAALGFAPRFGMQVLNKGRRSTLRSFNPAMRFTVAPRRGQANIGRAAVTLPPSVILDQSNIRTVCTRAQFAERACPDGAVYGYAKAWSPLLDKPVEGPVYLGSSSNKLPDLIADLKGQVNMVLQGRIDAVKGRMRTTFDVVPDVPVSRFVLTIRGGNNRGLLVNSQDLCRANTRGIANLRGQNNKRHLTRPAIRLGYKRCAQVRKRVARKQAQRKAQRRAAARTVARMVR